MTPRNLFDEIPGELAEELVEVLAEGKGTLRIERIVSRGHSSAEDSWYDQDSAEWVVLLRGSAVLCFAGDDRQVELKPGDWIEIPPHRRHRVEYTSDAEDTVWLAVHWD